MSETRSWLKKKVIFRMLSNTPLPELGYFVFHGQLPAMDCAELKLRLGFCSIDYQERLGSCDGARMRVRVSNWLEHIPYCPVQPKPDGGVLTIPCTNGSPPVISIGASISSKSAFANWHAALSAVCFRSIIARLSGFSESSNLSQATLTM